MAHAAVLCPSFYRAQLLFNPTRWDRMLASFRAAIIGFLQRMADRGSHIVVRLRMGAHVEPDVESANVIGELRGRERPDELVVIGGHIDSWDVGAGASDDGAGCVVTWEALRIMKKLNMRPRRTVRIGSARTNWVRTP